MKVVVEQKNLKNRILKRVFQKEIQKQHQAMKKNNNNKIFFINNLQRFYPGM